MMKYSSLMLCLLLIASGCSSPTAPTTIGLRVFNENPRHFDPSEKTERIWLELRAKATDKIICRAIIPNGFHAPMEIHGLSRNPQGLILILEYEGLVESTNKYGDIKFRQLIPADNDLDIRIRWVPRAPSHAPFLEQIKRKPMLDISYGHMPIF